MVGRGKIGLAARAVRRQRWIVAGLGLAAAAAVAMLGTPAAAPADDSARGARLYRSHCLRCHRLEPEANRLGPTLFGLFDRPAGSAAGYRRYSRTLREGTFRWNDALLDRYLADPRAIAPDNRMPFSGYRSRADRADVIAYLRERFGDAATGASQ